MRTVLDKKTLAFEEGYKAYESGASAASNPYNADQPDLRASWSDGWNYGKSCGGSCDG